MNTPGPLWSSRKEAFSLVELLAGVAIAAVLGALATSGLQTARNAADAAKCAANLRTVGICIAEYAADHDGYLPGPALYGQPPFYSKNYAANLGTLLSSYLGLPTPTTQMAYVSQLLCPAWKRKTKNPLGVAWYCPNQVTVGTTSLAPFGTVGGTAPLRVVALGSLGSVVALQEIDKKSPYQALGADWWNALPEQSVHPRRRNTLYLDGHVTAE